MLQALIFVVFPFCMVFAALTDMLSMTIANRVSLLLVATFAIVAPLTGMGWHDYGMHIAAAGLVLIVTFGLFAMGGMGGGDAKLLAATSLWMGFDMLLLQYLVSASLLGGMLTIATLSYRNSDISIFTGHHPFLRHLADRKAGIPYGIALGAAGLMIYPETPLMEWALRSLAGQ